MTESAAQDAHRRRGSVGRLATASYLGALLGIVTGPLIARSLGPSGRGEYAAISIYCAFTLALVAGGLTQSINYAVQTLKLDPGRVYGAVLRFSAFALIPSSAIAVLVVTLAMDGFSSEARAGALVLISTSPVGVLQLCLTSFLLAEGALGVVTVARVAPLVVSAAAVVGLAALGVLSLGPYLVVTFIAALVPLVITERGAKLRPARGQSLIPLLKFGVRAYPGSLALLANFHLDQVLIAPLLSATDLGHYAVAVSLANMPLGIVQAIASRGISEVNAESGALDLDRAGRVLRQGIVFTLAVTLAVAVVVPIGIPIVYGTDFAASVPLCMVLLVGTIALGVSSVASFCLTLAGKPGANSIAELGALIVTVASLASMLPTIGVIGASVASTLAYWTRATVQLRALRTTGMRDFVPHRDDFRAAFNTVRQRLPSAAKGRKSPDAH